MTNRRKKSDFVTLKDRKDRKDSDPSDTRLCTPSPWAYVHFGTGCGLRSRCEWGSGSGVGMRYIASLYPVAPIPNTFTNMKKHSNKTWIHGGARAIMMTNNRQDSQGQPKTTTTAGLAKPKRISPGRQPKVSKIRLENVVVGSRVKGVVTGITDFGCFINIGAQRDAFMHISKISNQFIDNIRSHVALGDAFEVEVLRVDVPRQKIQLRKVLSEAEQAIPNPRLPKDSFMDKKNKLEQWLQQNQLDIAQFVKGKVVSILAFGAFLEVGLPIHGLLHISCMGAQSIEVGDQVDVRIQNIDPQRGRIELSMLPLGAQESKAQTTTN